MQEALVAEKELVRKLEGRIVAQVLLLLLAVIVLLMLFTASESLQFPQHCRNVRFKSSDSKLQRSRAQTRP